MYYGDIRLGDTIDIKFTTRRFTTGAPFTLAGTPTVAAYPGNSTTEVTAGITLTVDFDARTGLNNVRVVASGVNGYLTATNYFLVITAGTVDSVSVVGEVVGSFSIEARSALMPTTAARTLDVTAANKVNGVVLTDTLTTYTGNTVQTGDGFARLGAPAGASVSADVAAVKVDTAAILVDTGTTLDGRIPAALVGGRMDSSVGAMAANVVTDAAVAADVTIASVTGAVGSVTGAVGSVTGAVGSVTAAVTVGTNNDKLGYGLSAAAVQAIWDALTSALTTVGSIGKLLVDNINATIGSRSSHAAADVWTVGTRALTDKAGFSLGAGGVISGAIAAAELNAIADALLDRNMTTGTDSGTDSGVTRTVRQALRRLRNREAIAAGTGTVYKEDDITASWTYAATATAGDPLSQVNPT